MAIQQNPFPDRVSLIARAEQCRTLGEGFRDQSLRERMFQLAVFYERVASSAEALEATKIAVDRGGCGP